MKKIIIVTPRSPFSGRGADEQDRLCGIKWFIDNGWDVRVITKVFPSDIPVVDKARVALGIKIISVGYKNNRSLTRIAKRLVNPLFWDGAAYEYFDKEIQTSLASEIRDLKPDLVWFDYTYLWPLYSLVRKNGVPVVTRSINFEPLHFLDEDGWTIINLLRSIPKFYSEWRSSRDSKVLFSITPKEESIYRYMGAHVSNLPLRGLKDKIVVTNHKTPRGDVVKLGFTASNYNVSHNLAAIKFLLREVLPMLSQSCELHFTGANLPRDVVDFLPKNAVYHGVVPDITLFWQSVDVAVVPSLFGYGMQQKVFEPMALGVPTVTYARAIAGYPFISDKHFICVQDGSANDFVTAINNLISSADLSRYISDNSAELSREMFSSGIIDNILRQALRDL